MFYTYAVRKLPNGEKDRHFIGTFERIDAAKHLANCATLGNADYAYVKDSQGGTVFYLEKINPVILYDEETPGPRHRRRLSPA